MIIEDETHPTATLDTLALTPAQALDRLSGKMEAFRPLDLLRVDQNEPTEVPRSFVAHVDEDGRKMYRIPWGADMAEAQRKVKAIVKAMKRQRTGLAASHFAMLHSKAKRRRKIADRSRRRNRCLA